MAECIVSGASGGATVSTGTFTFNQVPEFVSDSGVEVNLGGKPRFLSINASSYSTTLCGEITKTAAYFSTNEIFHVTPTPTGFKAFTERSSGVEGETGYYFAIM